MAIWSFTAERVARLKEQIANKKAQHDELLALSEKDLWCIDLDAFMEEWERQLLLDKEIQTNINRMGRRASKKIGAGRGRKAARDDDDYDPGAAKKTKGKKAAPKAAETKSHQRFAEMFSAKPKAKPKEEDEDAAMKSEFSDDDLAAFTAKAAPKKSESVEPSETNARGRRAAAAKPKAWIVESDSDGESMLGDINDMVKGIGKSEAPTSSSSRGRVSLISMSQGGSGGRQELPKTKPKRTFDFSDDDTNYEMLAKSSPRKSIRGDEDDIDQFLSDDDFPAPTAKAATAAAAPKAPKPVAPPKKRAAAAPKKAAPKKKEVLSPAAKAYAKKAATRKAVSEDEAEEEEEEESFAPRRPARAARAARGAAKAKPKYFDSEDEDDDGDFGGGDGDSDDPFGMDSD